MTLESWIKIRTTESVDNARSKKCKTPGFNGRNGGRNPRITPQSISCPPNPVCGRASAFHPPQPQPHAAYALPNPRTTGTPTDLRLQLQCSFSSIDLRSPPTRPTIPRRAIGHARHMHLHHCGMIRWSLPEKHISPCLHRSLSIRDFSRDVQSIGPCFSMHSFSQKFCQQTCGNTSATSVSATA